MSVVLAKNIPNQDSNSESWVSWHKAMKEEMGKDLSNALFLQNWEKNSSYQANDENLRSYLKSSGIDLDSDWTDDIADFASDPLGIVSTFKTVRTGGLIVVGVVVLIILIYLVILLNQMAKDPSLATGLAKTVATRGMA